ncbi:hypothetical protein K7H91_13890 [Martelella mediterranea]|nr:hypothetical protein [Martelella mediterranea]MCD1634858.1 hypothetical protein [Martelella mediterranea]
MLDWFAVVRHRRKKPRHPLADPLEDDEWRGHQWVAHLISRLLRERV